MRPRDHADAGADRAPRARPRRPPPRVARQLPERLSTRARADPDGAYEQAVQSLRDFVRAKHTRRSFPARTTGSARPTCSSGSSTRRSSPSPTFSSGSRASDYAPAAAGYAARPRVPAARQRQRGAPGFERVVADYPGITGGARRRSRLTGSSRRHAVAPPRCGRPSRAEHLGHAVLAPPFAALERQIDDEGRAGAGPTLGANRAAVMLDDAAADGEPDAGAGRPLRPGSCSKRSKIFSASLSAKPCPLSLTRISQWRVAVAA